MKYIFSLFIFSTALIAVVYSYPGVSSSQSQRDVDFDREDPVIVLGGVSPLEDDFGSSFLSSMQSMMNRLRQQIAQHLPTYPISGSFFGFNNVPEGANTTSTTKVINGHVVTVNETTYSDGDDLQGSVVRIRIIDVKPENDDAIDNPDAERINGDTDEGEGPAASNTDRSIESVEDLTGNEIPKSSGDVLTA